MDKSELRRLRSSRRWKETRLVVLRRDNHVCQLCGGLADQVDHRNPAWMLETSVEFLDVGSLEAACGDCNRRKSFGPEERAANVWDKELARAVYRECPGHGPECESFLSRS